MPPTVPTVNWSWTLSWLVAPNATVSLPPLHMPAPDRLGASATVIVLSITLAMLPTVVSEAMLRGFLLSVGVPLLATVMVLLAAAKALTVSQPVAAARLKVPELAAVVPLLFSSASTAGWLVAPIWIATLLAVGVPLMASPLPSVKTPPPSPLSVRPLRV